MINKFPSFVKLLSTMSLIEAENYLSSVVKAKIIGKRDYNRIIKQVKFNINLRLGI